MSVEPTAPLPVAPPPKSGEYCVEFVTEVIAEEVMEIQVTFP